jgi:hypothetical protein
MSTANQVRYLVLTACNAYTPRVTPDSMAVTANCGHRAWVAPDGLEVIDQCYTICAPCMAATYIAPGRTPEVRPTPGATARVDGIFGGGTTDQMTATLRDFLRGRGAWRG